VGGEEFALLLPETNRTDAFALTERLRSAVERLRLEAPKVVRTISVGLAEVLPGETAVDAALARAHQALYAAKRAGRNRIVRFDLLGLARGAAWSPSS
jgi:diguanylate cyclase (GGDEF)-like protein